MQISPGKSSLAEGLSLPPLQWQTLLCRLARGGQNLPMHRLQKTDDPDGWNDFSQHQDLFVRMVSDYVFFDAVKEQHFHP